MILGLTATTMPWQSICAEGSRGTGKYTATRCRFGHSLHRSQAAASDTPQLKNTSKRLRSRSKPSGPLRVPQRFLPAASDKTGTETLRILF